MDFIDDINNNIQYIMNKYFIKDFIERFESSYGYILNWKRMEPGGEV